MHSMSTGSSEHHSVITRRYAASNVLLNLGDLR